MTEQWYTAKCLYQSVHAGDEPAHDPLREYRYFLVRAENDSHAMEKAAILAKTREHSYINQFGATVQWRLKQVVDVKKIFDFELKDGLEIYHEYMDGGA